MNVQFERIKKRANLSLPVLADMDQKIVFELQFQTTVLRSKRPLLEFANDILGFLSPPLGFSNGILRS